MVINNSFLDALRQTDTAQVNGGDDEEIPLLVPTTRTTSRARFEQPAPDDTPIELASAPESTTPPDDDGDDDDEDEVNNRP